MFAVSVDFLQAARVGWPIVTGGPTQWNSSSHAEGLNPVSDSGPQTQGSCVPSSMRQTVQKGLMPMALSMPDMTCSLKNTSPSPGSVPCQAALS